MVLMRGNDCAQKTAAICRGGSLTGGPIQLLLRGRKYQGVPGVTACLKRDQLLGGGRWKVGCYGFAFVFFLNILNKIVIQRGASGQGLFLSPGRKSFYGNKLPVASSFGGRSARYCGDRGSRLLTTTPWQPFPAVAWIYRPFPINIATCPGK